MVKCCPCDTGKVYLHMPSTDDSKGEGIDFSEKIALGSREYEPNTTSDMKIWICHEYLSEYFRERYSPP